MFHSQYSKPFDFNDSFDRIVFFFYLSIWRFCACKCWNRGGHVVRTFLQQIQFIEYEKLWHRSHGNNEAFNRTLVQFFSQLIGKKEKMEKLCAYIRYHGYVPALRNYCFDMASALWSKYRCNTITDHFGYGTSG